MIKLITDSKIIKSVDNVLGNICEIISLKENINETLDTGLMINKILKDENEIEIALMDNPDLGKEIKTVLNNVKRIIVSNQKMNKPESAKHAIIDSLYNETYGNITTIAKNLGGFSEMSYVEKVEKNFNRIEKNSENLISQ